MIQLSVGLLGGIFLIYLATLNWQLSVKVALVLAVIEGALRKWALPQASQLIYFLKDFVLLGAYLSYFSGFYGRWMLGIKNKALSILILLMLGCCLLQIFNPSLGSPLVGILGVKNYLFYLPLLWIVPSLLPSEEKLYQFLRSYLLLLIPVGLLAIAQFFSPADSPLNTYAPGIGNMAVAMNGDGRSVRVTGTFSYLSGYTAYLCICTALLLPILGRSQPFRWRQLTILELLLVAITLFMTGARGLLINNAFILFAYLGLLGITSLKQFCQTIKRLFIPSFLGFLIISFKFRPAVDALWLRVTSNQDLSGRVGNSFLQPLQFWHYAGLPGYGAGATFQAADFFRNLFDLPPGDAIPVYYEEEPGRVMLELGPVGFCIWYSLRIILLIALWKVYCRLKRPFSRQLALCIFLLHCSWLNGSVVFLHTANLYYWFLSGTAFLLLRLERIEQWRKQQTSLVVQHEGRYLPSPSHR